MKTKLLSLAFLGLGLTSNAQTWTRVHAEPDTLSPITVDYDNIGDTIMKRQRSVSNFSTFHNFISLNEGNNFTFSASDIDPTFNASRYGKLPINKKIIGYKNAPNVGSYLFNGGTNWQTLFTNVQGIGYYFETGTNEMFYTVGGIVFSFDASNPNLDNQVHNWSEAFDLRCHMNVGNRTFFGLQNGKISFIDNGNFATYQNATVNFSETNVGIKNLWKAGSTLFATVETFYHVLLKSIDNGLTWNEVVTNSPAGILNENKYINGTSDGRIYYYSDKATSDYLFVSTDGGQNATQVDLPTGIDTVFAGYNLGKILVSNNKVWLNIVSYNATDFAKPHPLLSGLWQLDGLTNSISEQKMDEVNVFPNPFSTQISICNVLNAQISVVTLEGKEVYSTISENEQLTFDTTNLTTGAYLLKITSNKGEKVILITKH